jgi:hypothetical protein
LRKVARWMPIEVFPYRITGLAKPIRLYPVQGVAAGVCRDPMPYECVMPEGLVKHFLQLTLYTFRGFRMMIDIIEGTCFRCFRCCEPFGGRRSQLFPDLGISNNTNYLIHLVPNSDPILKDSKRKDENQINHWSVYLHSHPANLNSA